jgi:hypothetical protein
MHSPRRVRSRRTLLVAALVASAAGCQDYATTPDTPMAPATVTRASGTVGAAQIPSPYTCFVSIATPGGPRAYRYGRMDLRFPQPMLAPGGAITEFRFRAYGKDRQVELLADCVVPRTAAAVRMTSRRFWIPRGTDSGMAASTTEPMPVGDDPGEMTIQECYRVTSGEYYCDGIRGGGPGETDPGDGSGGIDCNEAKTCGWTDGSGGDISDPRLGGGSCTSSCDSGGTLEQGNPDSDCGVLECPREQPDTVQQRQYMQAIAKIDKTKCPKLYQAALELYNGFKVWSNTKYTYSNGKRSVDLAAYTDQPRYVSFWVGAFSRSDFPVTVAHEAAHDLLYADEGDAAETYARSCTS